MKKRLLVLHACQLIYGGMLFLTTGLLQPASAQSTIRGLVTDNNSQPVPNANVLLLNAKDSSLIKGMVTNASGIYLFDKVAAGKYIVSATFIGYHQVYTGMLTIIAGKEDINIPSFILRKEETQLAGVTVQAKKPLFEQKIDRMVVNVRNSITSATGSVLDVLEKSPGVIVNRQNNSISMNGKSGVVIMINGKKNYMPIDAIVQMLAGMDAGNIEKLELITTPPANFDAEGNAGYINIVFINNPYQGISGSWSLKMGYGKGETSAANFNFNYRKKKVNFYGDYSFSRDHQKQLFTNYRVIDTKGVVTENNTSSDRNPIQRNHNLRLGMDYQLSRKTVLGVLLAAYDTKWTMTANNDVTITKNKTPDTLLHTINTELNQWDHFMTNINLQHTFKPEELLSVDGNYIYYHDNNPNHYTNSYQNGMGVPLFIAETRSGKTTPIHFVVGSVDYRKKINTKVDMEAGIKASGSGFNNNISVDKKNQDVWVADTGFTANYHLKENIAAAYTSFGVQINDKTNIKAGLRYEHTTSNLQTATVKNIVDRKYGNLFPSLFISRKMNDNNSINLSYTRRITRPTFNDLAPFTIFLDPSTFFSGNPALQPAISNTVKADYLYKSYVFSLSYTYETNSIASFQTEVDTATNRQFMTSENLTSTKLVSAIIAVPVTITKWWTSENNVTGNWQQIDATINKTVQRVKKADVNISTTQRFQLPQSWSIELFAFYQSPTLFGITKAAPFGSVDIGIQKKTADKKNNFRFTVSNIFNTLSFVGITNMPQQYFYTRSEFMFNPTTVKISFSHNFGNHQLKEKRDRGTGSEEELRRVHQ